MNKTKEIKKQAANSNGKREMSPKYERLPKDYEVDDSPAAKAFMKAVRITHKRLYPELYEKTKNRA